jgi:hypothetical protein
MSTANATTTPQLPPVVFSRSGCRQHLSKAASRAEGASQMYISARCQLIRAREGDVA